MTLQWSVDFGHCAALPTHPLLDESLVIDLAEPAIRRTIARAHGCGVISWEMGGAEVASIDYIWTGRSLVLRFRAGGAQRQQVIDTIRTKPRFGGSRTWFVCPLLRRPVRALVLPLGAVRWAARKAHDAAYASQRVRTGAAAALTRDLRRAHARRRRNHIRRLRRLERTRE